MEVRSSQDSLSETLGSPRRPHQAGGVLRGDLNINAAEVQPISVLYEKAKPWLPYS
jgi:hypothetical protein